jgi:hypothetical protein
VAKRGIPPNRFRLNEAKPNAATKNGLCSPVVLCLIPEWDGTDDGDFEFALYTTLLGSPIVETCGGTMIWFVEESARLPADWGGRFDTWPRAAQAPHRI